MVATTNQDCTESMSVLPVWSYSTIPASRRIFILQFEQVRSDIPLRDSSPK